MRLYITPSWRDAAEGHDSWSMESPDDRKRRSHTLPNGNANLQSYSDEAIGEKKASKISIQDRILPQKKRLSTLRDQLIELETEYKTTQMSIEEYSTLRDILMVKINRAEVLYKKAISTSHTPENINESEEFGVEYATQNSVTEVGCGVAWVDELSSENCFKKIMQNTCKASRTLVKWFQRAKAYYQTLKEV